MDSVISPSELLSFDAARAQMRRAIEQWAADPFAGDQPGFVRIEFRISAQDILGWLTKTQEKSKFYWSGRENGFETGGVGIADCLKGQGSQRDYREIVETISTGLHGQHPNLRYYGGFSFDTDNMDQFWKPFGTYQLVIPRFEILHIGDRCIFACNLKISKDRKDDPATILAMLDRLQSPAMSGYLNKINLTERSDEPARVAWISGLNELIPQLKAGAIEKVVLARRSGWRIAGRLNAFELMQPLRTTMPNCFCFCFQVDEDHAFFGASPERLYKREGEDFWTEALAGTRPRGNSPQEDKALGEALLNSKKDFKEHQFVVAAIQNVLQSICSNVEGDSGASLLSFKGGHHLLSQFKGRLRPDVSDADIFAALHPTPAVGGHPAEAAFAQIRKYEPFARGWYAAPVGYIGADAAEFAVAIRSGLIARESLFLFAGAGVVGDSHPQEEWNEVEEKMNSLLKALSL